MTIAVDMGRKATKTNKQTNKRSTSVYLRTTDQQNSELLLNNSHTRVDLFRFLHTINNEHTFEVFSFFQLFAIALKKSCNSWTVSHWFTLFVMSFKHQNNVTLSNGMTDVILKWQLMSTSMHFPHAFKTVTLLFQITRFLSIVI